MSGSPVTAAPPSQSGSEAPENEEMIGSTAMSRSLSSASSLSTAPSDVLYTPIAHRSLTLPTVSEDDAIDTQYSVSASNSRSDSAGDPGLEITVATETRSESLRAARKTAREERAAQARERITDMSHAHRAARYHHLANAKHALSGCRDLAACALGKSSGPSSTQ